MMSNLTVRDGSTCEIWRRKKQLHWIRLLYLYSVQARVWLYQKKSGTSTYLRYQIFPVLAPVPPKKCKIPWNSPAPNFTHNGSGTFFSTKFFRYQFRCHLKKTENSRDRDVTLWYRPSATFALFITHHLHQGKYWWVAWMMPAPPFQMWRCSLGLPPTRALSLTCLNRGLATLSPSFLRAGWLSVEEQMGLPTLLPVYPGLKAATHGLCSIAWGL